MHKFNFALALASMALVACGGGTSGDPTASNVTLSGTAATGAAVRSGQVSAFDKTSQVVATSSTNDSGKYQLVIPTSAQSPLILKLDFAGQSLYSVAPSVAKTTVNINQLTDATVALLSPSGKASNIIAEISQGSVSLTSTAISTQVDRLKSAIKPISAVIGNDVVDFLNGSFDADGTGTDKLLDAVQIQVEPQGSDASTQVVFNTVGDPDAASDQQPISFTKTEKIDTSNITFKKEDLPHQDLPKMYQAFIDQFNACYALPLEQRAQNGALVADACKRLFKNANPSQYKNGGLNASESFTGMYSQDKTFSFSAAKTPYLVYSLKPDDNNKIQGKAIVAMRVYDSYGNARNNNLVVEAYTTSDGEQLLGAVGDQNSVRFSVTTTLAATHHPLANNSKDDYVSSSYEIFIPNQPNIKRAVITAPSGKTFVMGPKDSRSQLFICGEDDLDANQIPVGDCSLSPAIYMGLRFIDDERFQKGESPYQNPNIRGFLAYAPSHDENNTQCPAFSYALDDQTVVQPTCPYTDQEIEGLRPSTVWQATIEYTDGTPAVEGLRARTTSRPLSNRELMAANGPNQAAAKFTQETIQYWKSLNQAAVDDQRAPSWWLDADEQVPVWSPSTGGYKFAWTVEQGQEEPRRVYMSGKVASYTQNNDRQFYNSAYRPVYDEIQYFASSQRSTELGCTLSDEHDVSCDGVTGVWQGPDQPLANVNQIAATKGFADGTYMHYAQLWTLDQNNRNLKREYNLFRP